MLLPLPEVKRFFRLLYSLMNHVEADRRKGGKKGGGRVGTPYEKLAPQRRFSVHQRFAQDPSGHVERYLKDNPDRLGADDLAEIAAWKYAVSGRFIFYRQLKKHLIVLETTPRPRVFAIIGLSQPIEELVVGLPSLGECLLLPFGGAIICDGLISSQPILFGPAYRKSFEALYKAAKASRSIIETLGPAAKKPPKPRAKAGAALANLVSALRESLSRFRKERAELARFEDEAIPAFEQWLEKHLGRQREELALLNREIEELENALDILTFNEIPESCQTGSEAVEVALRMARSNGVEGSGEEGENEDEGFVSGPPDAMMEALFEVFMAEMRGIDVLDMDDVVAKKAFKEFRESFRHAEEGNRSAFERTLLGIEADRSEGNLKNVATAYRRVARLLHPDKGAEHDEETKDLWERLRSAKDALDLGTIERVEIEWLLIEGHVFEKPDLPKLKAFEKQLKADFADLKELREDLSTHPMWGCVGRKPPKSLARSLKAEINAEIRMLKFEKADLDARIDAFRRIKPGGRMPQPFVKAPSTPSPKKRTQRERSAEPNPDQMEFGF